MTPVILRALAPVSSRAISEGSPVTGGPFAAFSVTAPISLTVVDH